MELFFKWVVFTFCLTYGVTALIYGIIHIFKVLRKNIVQYQIDKSLSGKPWLVVLVAMFIGSQILSFFVYLEVKRQEQLMQDAFKELLKETPSFRKKIQKPENNLRYHPYK